MTHHNILEAQNIKAKLLIIDDDPIVTQATIFALQANGYLVDTIESGEVAVEVIKNDPAKYGIILLDLMIHDISGYEVLIEIGEIIKEYNISVVVHSGLNSSSERDKVKRLGAKGFISKPYMIKSLLDIIEASTNPEPEILES